MALAQKLLIRQSQALVMTPQLMQAIKLLQLSNLDLAAYVQAELERNPLLDCETEHDSPSVASIAVQPPEEPAADDEAWKQGELEPISNATDGGLDMRVDDAFHEDGAPNPQRAAETLPGYSEWSGARPGRDDGDYNSEAVASAETTLADCLREQLTLAIADPVRRIIGQYLIDLVDEAGYLSGGLDGTAERLGTSFDEVEAVLAILQSFDPPGVCARDLAECLALQLKARDRFDPAMQELIRHLDLLAKRDFATLKKVCGVGDEDLADMIAEIRRLHPKPGHAFGSAPVQPVVPDVFVRPAAGGGWLVELNSDTLPKMLINRRYYAEVSAAVRRDADRSYLAECMQNATWLLRALDQRARTILKVANEIVRQQDAFLARGIEHLRPLNLKTVADAIGMHESTISRAAANKYIATSRGIFEFKYLFTSAIGASRGGESHSAAAVRHRIRQLIDAEGVSDVLSDDSIVAKLHEAGVGVARRTVAKYREAMRIPSSVQRRWEKRAAIT